MNIRKIIFFLCIIFFESCSIFSEKKHHLSYDENNTNEESLFESGKRSYYSSLDLNLDQTKTHIAINKLQKFVQTYPYSYRVKEAYRLLNDLLMKIEKKNYYIANLYFLMRRYKASLMYFQDFIKDFPDSCFQEKVLYKICLSQYHLLRKNDFVKSYEEYIKYFPYSPNAKRLKFLYKKLKKL
ncbi:outer membrane protein assembly factor BamD [Blattabacterium cuenoti]|uniref:outer membrane protein assembly factor BamD n=1 Tax=Blattabacterium cuenoti TaxID=1653831 RepID=UPI00163BE7A2|nr:tetratricopeptide repeat protein [Blattabacterium cuenoti]